MIICLPLKDYKFPMNDVSSLFTLFSHEAETFGPTWTYYPNDKEVLQKIN